MLFAIYLVYRKVGNGSQAAQRSNPYVLRKNKLQLLMTDILQHEGGDTSQCSTVQDSNGNIWQRSAGSLLINDCSFLWAEGSTRKHLGHYLLNWHLRRDTKGNMD